MSSSADFSDEEDFSQKSGSASPAPGDTLPWNLPKHERSKRKVHGGSVLDPAERAVLRIAGKSWGEGGLGSSLARELHLFRISSWGDLLGAPGPRFELQEGEEDAHVYFLPRWSDLSCLLVTKLFVWPSLGLRESIFFKCLQTSASNFTIYVQ